MARGRPVAPVILSKTARSELETITRSRVLPHTLVRRARIILLAADEWSNTAIAAQVGLSGAMVGMWRKRFLAQGLVGLYDEPRPGGPRSIDDDRIAALIRKTLKTKPIAATHWSCRAMAGETHVSKSTVHRVWRAFGIQPHRQKHFHLSSDPFFVEKVRDIVGLYLNPPNNAMPILNSGISQVAVVWMVSEGKISVVPITTALRRRRRAYRASICVGTRTPHA